MSSLCIGTRVSFSNYCGISGRGTLITDGSHWNSPIVLLDEDVIGGWAIDDPDSSGDVSDEMRIKYSGRKGWYVRKTYLKRIELSDLGNKYE